MKEVRRIEIDKVRSLCIRNDYYTEGTNEAYANMFELCKIGNPTTNNYEFIALDIVAHSDVQDWCERTGLPMRAMVESVMFELINDCTRVHILEDNQYLELYPIDRLNSEALKKALADTKEAEFNNEDVDEKTLLDYNRMCGCLYDETGEFVEYKKGGE